MVCVVDVEDGFGGEGWAFHGKFVLLAGCRFFADFGLIRASPRPPMEIALNSRQGWGAVL